MRTIESCSRPEFVAGIHEEDKFARQYFLKHADEDRLWASTWGCFEDGVLAGAIALRTVYGKNSYYNIKLLTTFKRFEKKGIGRDLCRFAFTRAYKEGVKYFRISANPDAVEFYRKVGFKFWGKQRSGCSLSMFLINGALIENGVYLRDPYIETCLTKGIMGSCVELYDRPS